MTNYKLQNNIRKIYLYKIFSGMFFSTPVIVLFWQQNGLSLKEVMILQSLFSIMMVALEIPSGYFADLYGRKNSIILAAVGLFVGMSFYSLGHNFWQFLIGEIFFAISSSFLSGSMEALVYDTLKNDKREKQYAKIWGKMFFGAMLALAFSGIVGGLVATINLRYTVYLSLPFFLILIPLSISLQEPKRYKVIIQKGYGQELWQTIKGTFLSNKKLRWIMIYAGIIFAFNQSALWLYQPYFKLSGLNLAYFGFVFAGFQIVSAFSSKYAYKLKKKLGQKYSLAMLIFLVAGSYLLMGNFIFLFSFSFAFIQQFVRGFREVVVSDYINRLTDSSVRATVLSLGSFINRLLYALLLPIIGWLADVYTLTQALKLIGIIVLLIGIVMVGLLKKYRVLG